MDRLAASGGARRERDDIRLGIAAVAPLLSRAARWSAPSGALLSVALLVALDIARPRARPAWRARAPHGRSTATPSTGRCSGEPGPASGCRSWPRSPCSSSSRPASTPVASVGAGAGRIVSSLVLVALIVLSFGLGTGYDFTTTGLIPTAVVTCSLAIGLLRAAYASFALELMKVAGIRRRVVLVGEGAQPGAAPSRARRDPRRASATSSSAPSPAREVEDLPLLGSSVAELPAILEQFSPDELILSEADFDERTVLDVVERAHRAGVKVRLAPSTTELLVQKGEYVPGQGVPLFDLRPPILTGWGWVAKRAFDLLGSALIVVIGLPLWLLIALAIKLDSRGPVFYVDRRVGVGEREFGMLKFRTMVADAAEQQARARGGERGLGGAVQDPRRPARHARRPRPAPVLARRAAAARQRRCAAR